MARNNYGFQKRQKELARQAKKEEKRQRKLDRAREQGEAAPDATEEPGADQGQPGSSDGPPVL